MYDNRQFRPVMYLLVLLGITGFCIAAESPGLWVLAMGSILINAWMLRTGRFVPMRRWLANIITLSCVGVIALQMRGDQETKILIIGQGLVLLQIIKIYEQRANRDYAQLLILSFLLMVAAAISTASLLFGVCFVFYMFIALHACLLFHLKMESETIGGDSGPAVEQLSPASVRKQQEFLARSMRRVTVAMAVFAVAMAIGVFLFFPRGAGEAMLSTMDMRGQAMTGFTENVSFQKVAQITRNEAVVARLELFDGDAKVTDPIPILLRGSTLDVYNGDAGGASSRWTWRRSPNSFDEGGDIPMFPDDQMRDLTSPARGRFTQKITLQPTGTYALFSMAGPDRLKVSRNMSVQYYPRDGIIRATIALRTPIEYTVESTGQNPSSRPSPDEIPDSHYTSRIDPKVADFARRPEVCGVDTSNNPLAQYPLSGDHRFDQQIADNMQAYLRSNFQYTLDLTDLSNIGDRDPIEAFLTTFKAGHCEYFAGAMTAMCQSLGIPARMVVGFRCAEEDFNTLGDYYIVKQSNAHAWCEVNCNDQWRTYDPTVGTTAAIRARPTLATKVKDFFDYLEFKWATAIVAYGGNDRRNIMDNLDATMTRAAVNGSQRMYFWPDKVNGFIRQLNDWWQSKVWTVWSSILGTAIVLVLIIVPAAVVWFFLERWIMRRRARRIGLVSLPGSDQLRLARQLAFYDDLVRILERHRFVRPVQLTPLEFSRSLSHLPTAVYQDVHRLTELFYQVRYGNGRMSPQRQRWLANIIHRIQHALDAITA